MASKTNARVNKKNQMGGGPSGETLEEKKVVCHSQSTALGCWDGLTSDLNSPRTFSDDFCLSFSWPRSER